MATDFFGGLIDAIVQRAGELLAAFFEWLVGGIGLGLGALAKVLAQILIFTPAPRPADGILFGRPTNAPWGAIYDHYWTSMVPLAILLLLVSYFISQAAITFGLGSAARQQRVRRGLAIGILVIPCSWWLAVALLRFTNALTMALAPDVDKLGRVLQQVAVSGNEISVLLLTVTLLSLSLAAYVLVLVVHTIRIVGIFLLVFALPVLLAFDFGQFPYFGRFSRRLYSMLPPIVFVSIPVAFCLRLTLVVFGQNGEFHIDGLPLAPVLRPLLLLTPAAIAVLIPILAFMNTNSGRNLANLSTGVASLSARRQQAARLRERGQQTGASVRSKGGRGFQWLRGGRDDELPGNGPASGHPGGGNGGPPSAPIPSRTPATASPRRSTPMATSRQQRQQSGQRLAPLPEAETDSSNRSLQHQPDYITSQDGQTVSTTSLGRGTHQSRRRQDRQRQHRDEYVPTGVGRRYASRSGGPKSTPSDIIDLNPDGSASSDTYRPDLNDSGADDN